MKFNCGKWWFGFEWDKNEKYNIYLKNIYPFNWLVKDVRYWGYFEDYYDGTLPSFGFWFFNVSWSWGWWRS